MPIDGCTNTFIKMARTVLPNYMKAMSVAMRHPRPLTEFCTRGLGVKTIAKQLGRQGDLSGCYVLLRNGNPFYVGISRGVIARLRQHGTGVTHFDASLAYRMAYDRVPHKTTRAAAMKDPAFRRAFEEAKRRLIGSSVALIEIANPLELYLFEAYCAMKLDTCKWNTFRTH
jgi:hypothetical protein